MITGILLAGGRSVRMGAMKQMMSFGDKTVIETIVDELLKTALDELIVVLGHRWKEVTQALPSGPRVVVNEQYATGMLSSVKCGLRSLNPGTTGVLIALGDQPNLRARVVDELLRTFATRGGIVLPIYRGRRGHPIVLDMKYREETLGLDDEPGLRQVIWNHPGDISEVEVADEFVVQDMDRPEDYRRELSRRP